MASEVREADIHALLEERHVRYEVRPYYIVFERRPAGAAPVDQKIQAGFDVDLYGTLDKIQLPLFRSEEAHKIVDYFEKVAQEIQSKAEQHRTKVEVMPDEDSLVLDTKQHFQPEVMLRIRITHARGLDQPGGPSEEEALNRIREVLQELDVRQA